MRRYCGDFQRIKKAKANMATESIKCTADDTIADGIQNENKSENDWIEEAIFQLVENVLFDVFPNWYFRYDPAMKSRWTGCISLVCECSCAAYCRVLCFDKVCCTVRRAPHRQDKWLDPTLKHTWTSRENRSNGPGNEWWRETGNHDLHSILVEIGEQEKLVLWTAA